MDELVFGDPTPAPASAAAIVDCHELVPALASGRQVRVREVDGGARDAGDPSREMAMLEQRVKDAERSLRRLEAVEGAPSPPPVEDDAEQQQAPATYDREHALSGEFPRLCNRADLAGIHPDASAPAIRAEARIFGARAEALATLSDLDRRVARARGRDVSESRRLSEAAELEVLASGRAILAEIIEASHASSSGRSLHQRRLDRMRGGSQ